MVSVPGSRARGGDSYVEQLRLGARDALAAALDEDLVGLEVLASPALAVISRLARESDLDGVLLLQPQDVLALLANETGVILTRDLEHLGRLVRLGRTISNARSTPTSTTVTHQPLDLSQDPPLGLLDVLLAPDDGDLGLGMRDSLVLLLPAVLLLLLDLVREVDLDAELVAELVHARALRADNPADELAVDLKLDGL